MSSRVKVIQQIAQTLTALITNANGQSISMDAAQEFSAQAVITDLTPGTISFGNLSVITASNWIVLPSHGLKTGQAVTFTSSGTIPTPLLTLTTYYIIAVDNDHIRVAATLADALSNNPIILTGRGSGGENVVPTALAGSFQLQKSNDNVNWDNDGSATNFSAAGTYILENSATIPTTLYMRLQVVLTAGLATFVNTYLSKGIN